MEKSIPEKFLDLFTKKSYANIATLMPDGSPLVTPVWCDYDGEHVLINTVIGTMKDKNLQRDPRLSMSIMDPDNPHRYLEIRGQVAERTVEGADAHIDKMAKKYLGIDVYHGQPGQVRVLYKIKPERFQGLDYS